MTWVINQTVGCHYFPPGLQLPPQPLRGLLPIFAAWWTEARRVWTVCLRLLPNSVVAAILNSGPSALRPKSSTLTTRLSSHPFTLVPTENTGNVFISSVFVFFFFLWAKCKRQFSVSFLSCSCSRVDHVCFFLFNWFEQINGDDEI